MERWVGTTLVFCGVYNVPTLLRNTQRGLYRTGSSIHQQWLDNVEHIYIHRCSRDKKLMTIIFTSACKSRTQSRVLFRYIFQLTKFHQCFVKRFYFIKNGDTNYTCTSLQSTKKFLVVIIYIDLLAVLDRRLYHVLETL